MPVGSSTEQKGPAAEHAGGVRHVHAHPMTILPSDHHKWGRYRTYRRGPACAAAGPFCLVDVPTSIIYEEVMRTSSERVQVRHQLPARTRHEGHTDGEVPNGAPMNWVATDTAVKWG
jgi:hypothetical protein